MVDRHVWRWGVDFGRMGSLEGIFIATNKEIDAADGAYAYFGEVLGKHSQVDLTLRKGQFQMLSVEPGVVDFVHRHGPFGRNPLRYIREWCEICDEEKEPGEGCETCEEHECDTGG